MRRTLLQLLLALTLAGCRSEPEPPAGGTPSSSPAARDAGAMADLQASEKWTEPRCRWLEMGVWVTGDAQEMALYRAARELGYIDMEEAGTDDRSGVRETAWRVALRDEGRAEAAQCSPTSKPSTWGVPVSRRTFTSGTYVGDDQGQRTIYEVEYAWVPTAIGERVRRVLRGPMAVEEGAFRTRVYLRSGPDLTQPGPNGWWVDAIDDLDAVRLP